MHACARLAAVLALFVAALNTPATAHTNSTSRTARFTVVAANIRSFPTMSRHAYRHDVHRLTQIVGRKAVLGSEIKPRNGERWQWVHQWHAAGYAVLHRERETTQAIDTHGFRFVSSASRFIHRKVAGPASPSRYWVRTKTTISGYRVAFMSLHLTNGCTARHRFRWWYAARCRALRDEIATARHRVATLHANGWTVIIGGDLNTRHRVDWSPVSGERSIRPTTLMQIAVVPAAGVTAALRDTRVVRARRNGGVLFTDHNAPVTHVALTR